MTLEAQNFIKDSFVYSLVISCDLLVYDSKIEENLRFLVVSTHIKRCKGSSMCCCFR